MSSIVRILLLTACLTAETSYAQPIANRAAIPAGGSSGNAPAQVAGEFQTTMAFGAAVVSLMVFCRMLEKYRPWMAVGTAVFCLLAAGYGFAAGAWPLGLLTGAYAIGHLVKYVKSRRPQRLRIRPRVQRQPQLQSWEESRMSRLFG